MKKALVVVVLVVAVGFVATSCATGPSAQAAAWPGAGGIPERILQARRDALPIEGAIVGVGSANMGTVARSRSTATNRALGELTRQLGTIVEYMAIDLGVGAESNPGAQIEFQLEIQRTLARQTLRGVEIVEEYMAADGQYWVAARLSRQNAAMEIAAAADAAAALAPGANIAMWALGMMEDALGNALGQNSELPPVFAGD